MIQNSKLWLLIHPFLSFSLAVGRFELPGLPEVNKHLCSIQQRMDQREDLCAPTTGGWLNGRSSTVHRSAFALNSIAIPFGKHIWHGININELKKNINQNKNNKKKQKNITTRCSTLHWMNVGRINTALKFSLDGEYLGKSLKTMRKSSENWKKNKKESFNYLDTTFYSPSNLATSAWLFSDFFRHLQKITDEEIEAVFKLSRKTLFM